MWLIRWYQRALSARKPFPTCRFTPTCSSYALEAFEKRGFFAGLALTLWRILRCSPLSPCGYDPVPTAGFRTMPLRWSKYRRQAEQTEQPDQSEQSDQTDQFSEPDAANRPDGNPDGNGHGVDS